MRAEPDRTFSERVVVIAPTRRDGLVSREILAAAGIGSVVAEDAADLARLIAEGIGALLLTDIALNGPEAPALLRALEQQPPWSNIPVLALCREGFVSPPLGTASQALRNLTVLDRPSSKRALVSAIQAALRGRRWQYQIRDQIAELVLADRALRQADQRKDEFLATLAHELRNPLAPLKTGLELLHRGDIEREQSARLRGMMERQLGHLVRLIDELLDVSRIATGKIRLGRERIEMADVLRMAIESCQPLVEAARHRLRLDLPAAPVHVWGDATRLAQAVSNLINNAAKYTPDGGRVGVRLEVRDAEAIVTVSDSGAGIPPDMLERVFDMFTQVNRTLERSQGGLGIGLSLVRSLVTLHEGRVEARSDGLNRGSSFTIRLPLARGADAPAPAAPDIGDDAAAIAAEPHGLRILVVDDNADAADALALLLAATGHDTRTEYSGAAALRTASQFRPQAVFCDIGMPGMGGDELAALLRRDARFASTALVAVTGWGSNEDRNRTRRAGFDFHLTKPASIESLYAILDQVAPAPTRRTTH